MFRTSLFLVFLSGFAGAACGEFNTNNQWENKTLIDQGISADEGDAKTEQEEQLIYPKPMVSAAKSQSEFNYSYYDPRYSSPSTFSITAPASVDVRTPAEWEEKQALALSWTGNHAEVVASIIRHTEERAEILVTYDSEWSWYDFKNQMYQRGISMDGIRGVHLPNQTLWIRDFGPLSVTANGKLGFVDPRYYPGRYIDDSFPNGLAEEMNINNFRMPVDFEGGNFMSDGEGNCYASNIILSMNQGASENQIRNYFARYLGCEQLILLYPLFGEGTGHIDMFAKIVSPQDIMLGRYNSGQNGDSSLGTVDEINAEILNANADILSNVTLLNGSKLNVHRVPMPANSDNNFRTYVNTQFINGVNLIPVYRDDPRYQDEAVAMWQQVMPDWNHVAVDATELIRWAGAIHCILMEISEATLAKFQSDPAKICNHFDCFPPIDSTSANGRPSSSGNAPSNNANVTIVSNPPSTTVSSSCKSFEIEDCNGACAPREWKGDGYCDDERYIYDGQSINFNCAEHNQDVGDCSGGGACESDEIRDCRNHCAPRSWLGDGYCDEGYAYERTGKGIYFNCNTYQNDGGDCN
ncbi:MAG: agmatine deiminase family protein [Myxococcota bacterium]|nr:agmatine deiminase family protein [Myxococcota bacterium]